MGEEIKVGDMFEECEVVFTVFNNPAFLCDFVVTTIHGGLDVWQRKNGELAWELSEAPGVECVMKDMLKRMNNAIREAKERFGIKEDR